MVVRRGRGLTSIGAAAVACVVALASIGFVLAQAAPTTKLTTENDFRLYPTPDAAATFPFNYGQTLNGEVWVTEPDNSGQSEAGFIGRSRLTDPTANLGDFNGCDPLSVWYGVCVDTNGDGTVEAVVPTMAPGEDRAGAGLVISGGPLGSLVNPGEDTNKYLYIVGGKNTANVVLSSVLRAQIFADGRLGVPTGAGVVPSLLQPRFGASVVAWGKWIYAIAGYDSSQNAINSIERAEILPDGNISGWSYAVAEDVVEPNRSGDVAAVIVDGYLYVIGGVERGTGRGPNQVSLRATFRAPIYPSGALGQFERLAGMDLQVASGGGRAVVVRPSTNPGAEWVYYIGGSKGDNTGGSFGVYRFEVDVTSPTGAPPTQWINTGLELPVNNGRELFGLVVANGYMYVIGGASKTQFINSIYSSVCRAPVNADGTIGAFQVLNSSNNSVVINWDKSAADIFAVADNGNIYSAGGTQIDGGSLANLWHLSLNLAEGGVNASVESDGVYAGPFDSSVYKGVLDFGSDQSVNNIRFNLSQSPAGVAWVRFRYAKDGWTSFGVNGAGTDQGWSKYVRINQLPVVTQPAPPPGTTYYLLDLSYDDTVNPCSGDNKNPSGVGAFSARYVEYEVVFTAGDSRDALNEITINTQVLSYALPGGYNPGGLPCAPNWARADYNIPNSVLGEVAGYNTRIVRLKGAGFPAFVGGETFNFLPVGDNAGDAPAITVDSSTLVDGSTIDLVISIPAPAVAGTYVYDIQISGGAFTIPISLSPGLQVFPAVDVVDSGVDVDLANPGNQNVVQILDAAFTRQVAVFGSNFRSGRVNESGSTAVDDDASPFGWPTYGEQGDTAPAPVLFSVDNKFTTVCITDTTQPAGGITLYGGNADGCLNVGALGAAGLTEFINSGELRATLLFPPTTLSGAHELTVRVFNPSINSWDEEDFQTVYVIPYADVTDVNTAANTASPGLVGVFPNQWAQTNRGDGVTAEPLTINVVGTGFQSSTGSPLVRDPVIYIPSLGNGVQVAGGGWTVNSFTDFSIDTDVPLNAPTGAYLVGFNWSYTIGVDDPVGAIPPSDATTVSYTWPTAAPADRTAEAQAEQLGVYVLPPPPAVDSVFGNNCLGSIALLQGQPAEVKVNGNGFAVELPVFPTSTVISVTLKSIVDPSEDLVATSWTVLSDRQLVAYFNVPPGQRAGQLYYLEIVTTITSVVWPAGAPAAPISPLLVVVATPTCGEAFRVGTRCFYATPGEEAVQLEITGSNFGYSTTVDLGPGITILSKEVYRDATLIGPADGNTGNRILLNVTVANDAAAGPRTVVISNGETCGLNQSCTLATPFVVVTAPTVTGIQPSLIQQPSLTEGVKIETIDIYGTNFTPGTTVSIEGITVNNTIFMNSTHLKAELVINANTAGGEYTVVVTASSGTECAEGPIGTGTITIGVKPELFCETITPDQVSLGGPATAITVSGKGLEGFDRMAIASGNAIYELLLEDDDKDLGSITGTLFPPAFAGFNYNLLGEQWDVVLQNSQTGAILYCQDQFAIFAGTTITDVGVGAGAPTVCQGAILDNVPVYGTNFLPNLTTENVDFGPAVQTRAVRYVSATELSVDLSITDAVASIGTHALTITNPLPDGSQATLPGAVIVAAVPTVTGISDGTIAQGTEQQITITGSNFVNGTLVSITPSESGVFIKPNSTTIVSESQITTTLVSSSSSTPGTYSLVVTAPAPAPPGVPLSCSTFTFRNAITNVAAPNIIRIDPSTVGAGMQNVNLTITGSGFQPGAQVRLGYGSGNGPESEGYVTFCDGGGSMIYVRPGGGFIDPTRIVVCVNVYENTPPTFIPVEVINPDGGTAIAKDKFSVSVPNQPTPPSDLSAELFPNGKVTLTFQDNATNETGFVVEQSLNGGAWTVVKNIKANRGIGTITCTLTGLRAGNDYDYRVKAVNRSDGNIASPAAMLNYSVDVDTKISGRPVINVLEYRVDDKSYYDGILIEWTPPSGGEIRSYSILRSTSGGPWVSVGAVDGSVTEFFDTDVVTGTRYSYKIEARNNFNTRTFASRNIRP